MGRIDTSYEPFDPLNICSLCGTLERKKSLRRLPGGLFACNRPGCANERTATELDRANARQRPFRILPVPNARPQTWNLPDNYQVDEGEILNFLSRAVANRARYESVVGGTPAPVPGGMLAAFGWIARYLYGLINENKRPVVMLTKARELLRTIATVLLSRQRGFGITSGGKAFDPWYGAFLASGDTVYITNDIAACGLAMLHAYRTFGTGTYLDSARAAANYLRNVQGIGAHGAWFTSSDALGTERLNTGAVCSEVSAVFGVDPGELFYSNHLFYPSGLLALEFWDDFMEEDGDQMVGATGLCFDAFVTVPEQLLSTSINEMRVCWSNGIRDSENETYSGLSVATPREFFNAYPETKPQFPSVTGTGRWEYEDGDAATGTMVSSQNFVIAMMALYAYEGASDQFTSINSWLRSFTSNPEFETADDTSPSDSYRSTFGDYDPTLTIATSLQVRDPEEFYVTEINGSSIYDWGALGLLSPFWGTTYAAQFIQCRLTPLGRNQRYFDGTRSDGDHFDFITNRGLSGLGLQTAFGAPFAVGMYNDAVRAAQFGMCFRVNPNFPMSV